MENTIEITYTRKHTVELDEHEQDYIAQAIYDAFTRELSDYIDDGDTDNVPGDTLKEIFDRIVENMVEDEEFWED